MDGKTRRRNERIGKNQAKIIRAKETKSRRRKGKTGKKIISWTEKTQARNWLNYGKVRWETVWSVEKKNWIRLQNPGTRTLLRQTCLNLTRPTVRDPSLPRAVKAHCSVQAKTLKHGKE